MNTSPPPHNFASRDLIPPKKFSGSLAIHPIKTEIFRSKKKVSRLLDFFLESVSKLRARVGCKIRFDQPSHPAPGYFFGFWIQSWIFKILNPSLARAKIRFDWLPTHTMKRARVGYRIRFDPPTRLLDFFLDYESKLSSDESEWVIKSDFTAQPTHPPLSWISFILNPSWALMRSRVGYKILFDPPTNPASVFFIQNPSS